MLPTGQVIGDGTQSIIHMQTNDTDYRPLTTRQDKLIRAAILGENNFSRSEDKTYVRMHDFLIFNPYSESLSLPFASNDLS